VRTRHGYAFKGRLVHKSCGRRMQGNWLHDRAHYRCRFPNEYAIANKIDHPLNVYLREDQLRGPVDAWLAQAFAPPMIERSLAVMENAQPTTDGRADALRRTITECDRKLARHRAVAEAGRDPALVATWSREVQAEKAAAQARLARLGSNESARRMSRDEIRALVDALGGLMSVLRSADPADVAEVYRQLGLTLTYDHETRTVLAEVQPAPVGVVCVSEGGLEPPRPIKGTSTSS
jgi:site-specific DNA recombinase